MPPRLILNADDFGLTLGINRAIAELHRAEALTSATLMATGPAFDDAVALARTCPTLGVGCHIVLVDGTPTAKPAAIPTLLAKGRTTFHRSLPDFTQAVLRGAIREDEILHEAVAQIHKLQAAGVRVTHLDTHKHTHIFPAVTRSLLRAAGLTGVSAIRNPFEPEWSVLATPGATLRRAQLALLRQAFRHTFQTLTSQSRIATTDGTIGILATGTLDKASLHRLLRAIPSTGTWELVLHPGHPDATLEALPTRLRASRDIERHALLACIPNIPLNPNPPQLIHYGNLRPAPGAEEGTEKT